MKYIFLLVTIAIIIIRPSVSIRGEEVVQPSKQIPASSSPIETPENNKGSDDKKNSNDKGVFSQFKTGMPQELYVALSQIPDDSEWRVIQRAKYPAIVATIYKNESSFGKYDVCRARGQANGFGYNEWTGHSPTCYDSFETVVSLVDSWIENKLQEGLSLSELNCLYVRGIRASSCDTTYKLHYLN